METPKCLAVLLFHNDEDIIRDHINYYIQNNHDIIVFNHNSSDNTFNKIMEFKDKIKCYYELNDKIVFKNNEVHETVSIILMGKTTNHSNIKIIKTEEKTEKIFLKQMDKNDIINYTKLYDWISFPESDEFLEGPDRSKNYYSHLCELHNTDKKAIQFLNFVFWFTEKDDININSPIERIKHYAHFNNCGPRFYAWRARLTNIRWFGHNLPDNCDKTDIVYWKTRHYDARSYEHFKMKSFDRKDVAIGGQNGHYTRRYDDLNKKELYGIIHSDRLHYDNGISELVADNKFDWYEKIY